MNGASTMIVKRTKLRHLALGTQLFAGVTLLTASYLTTDSGWGNDVLTAAVQSEQTVVNSAFTSLKAGLTVNECS
jgi:hypothetical protein